MCGEVERENKKRASDEAWLSRELSKEGEKRKGVILKEAREERQFANQLTKEMQQRVKDERWLTRELEKEQKQRERDAERAAREAERANQKTSRGGRGGAGFGGIGDKIFATANAVFDAARGLKDIANWGLQDLAIADTSCRCPSCGQIGNGVWESAERASRAVRSTQ